MTVQQLIELLQEKDPTAEVVLSKDPEGNYYSTLEDASDGHYNNKECYYYTDEDLDFKEIDIEEEDTLIINDLVPCVCLWPSY